MKPDASLFAPLLLALGMPNPTLGCTVDNGVAPNVPGPFGVKLRSPLCPGSPDVLLSRKAPSAAFLGWRAHSQTSWDTPPPVTFRESTASRHRPAQASEQVTNEGVQSRRWGSLVGDHFVGIGHEGRGTRLLAKDPPAWIRQVLGM
jgi:hypothetical protein